MTDPALEYIEDRHYAHANFSFRLESCSPNGTEGHEKSGYRYASEEDANLLKSVLPATLRKTTSRLNQIYRWASFESTKAEVKHYKEVRI